MEPELFSYRQGRRFANEAANYNALGGAFHQLDPVGFTYPNLPCWLIFDDEYLAKYGFRSVPPGGAPPAWMPSADTLPQLAATLGMPPDAFTEPSSDGTRRSPPGRPGLPARRQRL